MNIHQSRRTILRLLGAASVCGGTTTVASPIDGQRDCRSDHLAWVSESLERMLTVKPGMNRDQLMRVFTTEGGLVFSPLQRTFVSRDCPYFKINVQFRRAEESHVDAGQLERDDDVITSISGPFLQFSIMD